MYFEKLIENILKSTHQVEIIIPDNTMLSR